MAELRSVPGPRSPLTGNSGKLVGVVLVAIAFAVIKPWGTPAGAPLAVASPTPTAAPSSTVPGPAPAGFDFGVFEGFEPAPAWEIWPAGREISFGFAMKIDADPDAPGPTPDASADATASASASDDGSPDASADATTPPAGLAPEPPRWTGSIVISSASTLTVVAINTPLDFDIPVVRLSRPGPDGERVDIPTIRLSSPWPDHFQVIGIDDGTGVDALDRWPPGEYTLELRIGPGGWVRTITIDVGAQPPTPAASPTEGTAPGPSEAGGGS